MGFFKFMAAAIVGCVLAIPVTWATTNPNAKPEKNVESKESEKLICDKTDVMEKTLEERGYVHLLDMTNNDNVVESMWIGGQSATIVAKVPGQETTCLLAVMSKVTYNSDVINQMYKNMEKQTKQKDI
jgi:hypothetical protein